MLALIAGSGALPAVLAASIEARGARALVAALEGHPPDGLVPDRGFRLETLGTLVADLRDQGVTEVCFAGAIRRPPVDPGQIDAATMPLVPRLMAALQKGDDGALREVLAIFEEAGLTVRAASDLAPELLPEAGVLSSTAPTAAHEQDAARAADVLATLGPLDIGQSIVVHRGQVLAVEGSFGTDWMLASLAERPDGQGGVFYKAAKPGQDRRVDLPLIGASTLQAVHAAGLDGVIIEAGGVMVLELDAVSRLADALGLFLQVRRS